MRHAWILTLLLFTGLASAQSPGLGNTTEFEVNGLKVILKQRPGIQTVACGVFVRGGSSTLSPSQAGVESLLLDASSEGSARFPRSMLRSELDRMATTISSGSNRDYSVLSFASTRTNFDRSWDIFTDVVLHPALLPGDVERIKRRVLSDLAGQMDVPDAALETSVANSIFTDHPYAVDPRGVSATIAKISPADLRAYHQRIMQTSRLLLVLVGDLDLYTVKQKVTAAFGQLPRGDYRPAPMPALKFVASRVTVVPHSLPTNYVEGVYAGPLLNSPDAAALDIASSILSDRVYREVRLKRSLSYAPSAFFTQNLATYGGIYVTTNDVNQAITVMLKEISRLKKEPVSADTLSGTVTRFGTSYYMNNETNAAQAAALAKYELIGGGWRNAESTLDRLRKVMPADVQRVAQQYMHDLQFTVLGKEDGFNKAVLTTEP
jgi:zinc protease